jgi:Kef-type K+ transport system membrane component KefB
MGNWMLPLCVVIAATSACGALARRLGQGKVVGELVAGLLLGPSMLGAIGGAGYHALFSPASAALLGKLGDLGLVFLMFQTGAHIVGDRRTSARAAWAPIVIATLGMVCPFVMGCALAYFGDASFGVPKVPRMASALFCGIALSVSALPVMARIVAEAGIAEHASARLAIVAAAITDTAGWLMLASVGAAATSGFSASPALRSVLMLTAFFGLSLTVVRVIVDALLDSAKRWSGGSAMLVCGLCYLLLSAWVATALGFHSAFGALIAAVNMARRRDLLQCWQLKFSGLAELILTPLFFVSAGLQASAAALNCAALWGWLAVFLVVGIVGKFGGCYVGARLCGIEHEPARVIGALMNSRGTVELMVLSIGLQLRLVSSSLYTILLVATLAMTAASAQLTHRWARSERDAVRSPVTTPAG